MVNLLMKTSKKSMSPKTTSTYDPNEPARRPGGKPGAAPRYRVLVNKQFRRKYSELANRVGLQQAQQLWDHIASSPGAHSPLASTTILRGRAGDPKGPGWSRTGHYEVGSMARVNYQFNDHFRTSTDGDEHRVVAILTIDYTSH